MAWITPFHSRGICLEAGALLLQATQIIPLFQEKKKTGKNEIKDGGEKGGGRKAGRGQGKKEEKENKGDSHHC